jgi:hypothetical protein
MTEESRLSVLPRMAALFLALRALEQGFYPASHREPLDSIFLLPIVLLLACWSENFGIYSLDHCAGCFEGWVAFQNIDLANYVDLEENPFQNMWILEIICAMEFMSIRFSQSRVLPIGENRNTESKSREASSFPESHPSLSGGESSENFVLYLSTEVAVRYELHIAYT